MKIDTDKLTLVVGGEIRRNDIDPIIVLPEYYDRHEPAAAVIERARSAGDDVVMFKLAPIPAAAKYLPVDPWRKQWDEDQVLYCLYSDWLAAGGHEIDPLGEYDDDTLRAASAHLRGLASGDIKPENRLSGVAAELRKNFYISNKSLFPLYREWPSFSGSDGYPIWDPDDRRSPSAQWKFAYDFWKEGTNQRRLRISLCVFLADYFDAILTRRERVRLGVQSQEAAS